MSDVSGAFRSVSCVVSLICRSQPNGLGANFGKDARCQICSSYETETIEHVLFMCETLSNVRTQYLDELRHVMPTAMWKDFHEMTTKLKLKYLLSGLNSRYIREWQDVLLCISKFVFDMYKVRSDCYNRLTHIISNDVDNPD